VKLGVPSWLMIELGPIRHDARTLTISDKARVVYAINAADNFYVAIRSILTNFLH
jgi:hypothetical protein